MLLRMAPGPIPAPLPPWAKALLQIAPFIPSLWQGALDYFGEMFDGTEETPSSWRHIQMVFADSGNADPRDRMVTTLDVANITGGAIDGTWTDADYTTVQAIVGQLATGWTTGFGQGRLRHLENRYYVSAFNPLSDPRPFMRGGSPERIFPGTAVGGASSAAIMQNQCSFTTTERTVYPRHWGRNYWPFPHNGLLSLQGGIATANVDALAQLVHDRYEDLMDAEFFPVVPITQVDKQPARGLLTVSEIQVDNVPDVIRRRRIAATGYRKVLPL